MARSRFILRFVAVLAGLTAVRAHDDDASGANRTGSALGMPSRLPEPRQWLGWKAKFHKSYATFEEDLERRLVWMKNQWIVDEHNKEFDSGQRSFRLAMNEFGDQGSSNRGLLKYSVIADSSSTSGKRPSSSTARRSSFDWRKQGAVLPVKDQGRMDSSLAINTADSVASFSFIHDSTALSALSVQEVVDCCLPFQLVDPTVFDCIKGDGGLCLNGTYHSGSMSNPCNASSCKPVSFVDNGGKKVPCGDEDALVDAVLTTPVIVAIDASHTSFQLYESGIYSEPSCSSTQLDHVLLVVGYGVDAATGIDYWICRNTWGLSWGDEGYIRIARNHGNMCGIATTPIYPY